MEKDTSSIGARAKMLGKELEMTGVTSISLTDSRKRRINGACLVPRNRELCLVCLAQ